MYFYITLFLIASLGYLAQTTGLCMVRGMKEALAGKPLFLLSILLSGSFAGLALWGVNLFVSQPLFVSYQASWYSVVGGLFFGFGAAVNSGCGVSTISRLARGQLAMFATLVGWLVGWVVFAAFITKVETLPFYLSDDIHFMSLVLLSLLIVVALFRFSKKQRVLWLSMLAIGLAASLVFIYEPRWTPSGLLKGISLSFWQHDASLWPSFERFMLMLSLVGGMWVAAVLGKSFVFTFMSFKQFIRHLLAGILMGMGALLASGGNDTQLLLALPAFSPAGFVSVINMLLGIYIGNRIMRR